MYMDNKKYTHVRLLTETAKPLKIISAITNESMLGIVNRLVKEEYKKLQDLGITLPELGGENAKA